MEIFHKSIELIGGSFVPLIVAVVIFAIIYIYYVAFSFLGKTMYWCSKCHTDVSYLVHGDICQECAWKDMEKRKN